jgi:hypothetical protein
MDDVAHMESELDHLMLPRQHLALIEREQRLARVRLEVSQELGVLSGAEWRDVCWLLQDDFRPSHEQLRLESERLTAGQQGRIRVGAAAF